MLTGLPSPPQLSVTRNGMIQRLIAGTRLPATNLYARSVIIDSIWAATASARRQKHHPKKQQSQLSAQIQVVIGYSQPSPRYQPKIKISIAVDLWAAGSFLGDFRTPVGTRNSSRKRTFNFRNTNAESYRKTLLWGSFTANSFEHFMLAAKQDKPELLVVHPNVRYKEWQTGDPDADAKACGEEKEAALQPT